MSVVSAPEQYCEAGPSVFLGGGITGTSPWQHEIITLLRQSGLVLLNPRRDNFSLAQPNIVEQQIRWEFDHLRRATARLFWIPPQTLCPIALFELGAWSRGAEPLFVGVHAEYRRKLDVQTQLQLARADVKITDSVDELANQVLQWALTLSQVKR